MKTFKEHKVVLLPINNITNFPTIVIEKLTNGEYQLFQVDNENDIDEENQFFIYILSDEKLPYDSKIFDEGAFYHIDALGDRHIINKNTFKPNPNFYKRIISSTDKSLNLPEPTIEFLQEFVKNPQKEIEVEYEPYEIGHFIREYWSVEKVIQRIKLNPDNTINCRLVEDSWNTIFNHPTVLKLSSQEALKIWLKDNYEVPKQLKK